MRSTCLLIAAPFLFLACGGSVSEATPDASDTGDQPDTVIVEETRPPEAGRIDAVVVTDGVVATDGVVVKSDSTPPREAGPRAPCPDAPPVDGTACGASALDCGWGEDPRPDCRTRAQCIGAAWRVTTKACAAPKYAAACPAEADAMKMATCAEKDAFCRYPTHLCECAGYDPKYLHWYCDPASSKAGCPIALPNLGTSCTVEGTSCVYGSCGVDTSGARRCDGGVWIDEFPPCGV